MPSADSAKYRNRVKRMLSPSTIAIIGIGDNSFYAPMVAETLNSDAEVFFVYPKSDMVMGRPSYPSLTAIGRSIDSVMVFVSAKLTMNVVQEAVGLDVGGLVLMAAGFAEVGAEGKVMQDRLRAMAEQHDMPVMGPNCMGYRHVPRQISLTMGASARRNPGGISVVSHSGAMLVGAACAADAYTACGFNYLISAGNEALTDVADYLDFLADDPGTSAIGLILEKIRRPAEFFAAAKRATAANKPIVALKLGRSERSRRIAVSHTGTLTSNAWSYDVAFRQAGIMLAYDTDELIERLAFFDQVPPERWVSGKGLAILTVAGGYASLSADVSAAEGVSIPELAHFTPWLADLITGATVPNPVDLTVIGMRELPAVLSKYAGSDDIDALLFYYTFTDEPSELSRSREIIGQFSSAAKDSDKIFILANYTGPLPRWAPSEAGPAVVAGNGLRSTLRGLQSMSSFVQYRSKAPAAVAAPQPVPRSAFRTVRQPEGEMVSFESTMALLRDYGIPVAPFSMVPGDAAPASLDVPFAGPYAAKLADMAHRTEHGAVIMNIPEERLPDAVRDLRALAERDGLLPLVAIQPLVEIEGELLLGIQSTELGPLVVLGLGGIFAEALRKIGGRVAPFSRGEACALIEEFREVSILHGFRGKPPWNLDALADILVNMSNLATASRDWLASFDINPLIYGPNGYQAVDALLLVRQVCCDK
jgi:acyl-CoA synthetase (NDP forming)